ncbi:MAG: pentapeptide repeat-containing protein [Gemmatimonadota bacterium]|nr:pentapeptide repeat-containing protein [Gemmatimonadota bacterium]
MNSEKSEKTWLHWLRAILSWVSRPISWLYCTIMDRRFWMIWFGRIKRFAAVMIYAIVFVTWLLGLIVLSSKLVVSVFPSSLDYVSFLPWTNLLLSKADPQEDLFSRVRMNMVILTAWVGVFFLVWRTRIADKQTQINQESHYTELFTKAVEQLGAVREVQGKEPEPALEIRIGAIYSLERLAKDSERDYGPIIETLSAYIREHCSDPKTFDSKGLRGNELRQERKKWIQSIRENPPAARSDVAAVLTVLSRREQNRQWTSTSDDETQPDFTGANFQGAHLEQANLSNTNLQGADLSGADLREADLREANLWRANLLGAILVQVDLSGAILFSVNLSGANLAEVHLKGAHLIMANLSDTHLINADPSGATLFRVNLSGANLLRVDLSDTSLFDIDLSGAHLEQANLSNTNLQGADLSGANLLEANLSNADFSVGNPSDVDLKVDNVLDLDEDHIRRILHADLPEASLSHALLAGANLKGAKGLTLNMIKKAFRDNKTTLPADLSQPTHWRSREKAIEGWVKFWESQGRTVLSTRYLL